MKAKRWMHALYQRASKRPVCYVTRPTADLNTVMSVSTSSEAAQLTDSTDDNMSDKWPTTYITADQQLAHQHLASNNDFNTTFSVFTDVLM